MKEAISKTQAGSPAKRTPRAKVENTTVVNNVVHMEAPVEKKTRKAKAAPAETVEEVKDHTPETASTPLADVVVTKLGKKLKLPKAKGAVALGKVADMLYAADQREAEIKLAIKKQFGKELEKLDDEYNALKEYLINSVPKSLATGVAGQLCRVSVVTKEVPTVKDWDALQAHIKKTGAWDLLGKELNKTAVQQRWDENKKIPGIDKFNAVKLSVNKL